MLAVMGEKNMAMPMMIVITHRSVLVKTVYGFVDGTDGSSISVRELSDFSCASDSIFFFMILPLITHFVASSQSPYGVLCH